MSKFEKALHKKYPNKDTKEALITLLAENGGSDHRAAVALGVWPNSVKYHRGKHGIEIVRSVEIEAVLS